MGKMVWRMLELFLVGLVVARNPAQALPCYSVTTALSSCTSFLQNPSPNVPDPQCCKDAFSVFVPGGWFRAPCDCLLSQGFLPHKVLMLPSSCNLKYLCPRDPSLAAVPNDFLPPVSTAPLESPDAGPGGVESPDAGPGVVEPPKPDSPLPNFQFPPFPNFQFPPFPNFPLPPLPNFPIPPFPGFPLPPLPIFPTPPLPFLPPSENPEQQKSAQSSDVATDGLLPPLPNLPLPPLPKIPIPPLPNLPLPPLANVEENH